MLGYSVTTQCLYMTKFPSTSEQALLQNWSWVYDFWAIHTRLIDMPQWPTVGICCLEKKYQNGSCRKSVSLESLFMRKVTGGICQEVRLGLTSRYSLLNTVVALPFPQYYLLPLFPALHKLPKFRQEEIDNLNNFVSIQEIKFVILKLLRKNYRGPHVFTGKFYQIFKY